MSAHVINNEDGREEHGSSPAPRRTKRPEPNRARGGRGAEAVELAAAARRAAHEAASAVNAAVADQARRRPRSGGCFVSRPSRRVTPRRPPRTAGVKLCALPPGRGSQAKRDEQVDAWRRPSMLLLDASGP